MSLTGLLKGRDTYDALQSSDFFVELSQHFSHTRGLLFHIPYVQGMIRFKGGQTIHYRSINGLSTPLWSRRCVGDLLNR